MAASISSQYFLAVPSENVRKSGFLTFTMSAEMEHQKESG